MRKVVLVGWDGADWNRIHPLLDSGAMPNLARMVERGVMGEFAPLTPLCSPLLWTSIATGEFADRHGILDFAEPDPVTGGVRPVTRASLQAPQLWDILAREGVRSQVSGWPATHPAQGPATCISNGFAHGSPRSVFPASLAPRIEPLRFHPREWTGDELRLFVPELASIDQANDKRIARLALALAESVSVHAAATALMETSEWDFAAVWFGAIGAVSEIFPSTAEPVYQEAAPGAYRFLDLLLGRLLQLAGPEATTILVSDRAADQREWIDSTGRGSRGMVCAAGSGIEPDELMFGAGLLDIVPTILGLFGLIARPEMPGQILNEICPNVPERALQPMPAPGAPVSLEALLDRDLRELAALGYRDEVAEANRPQAEASAMRRNFHLARVLMGQGRAGEAVPILEQIGAKDPANLEVRVYRAHAYFQTGKLEQCRAICDALLSEHPEPYLAALAGAHLAIAEGDYVKAREHLRSARGGDSVSAALDAAIGLAHLRARNWDEAAKSFRSAIEADSAMPAAHQGLSRAMLGARRYQEAADAALDAIRLRYDLGEAHAILAVSLRALGKEETARRALHASRSLRRRRAPA